MTPELALLDLSISAHNDTRPHALPHFLDGSYNPADESGDWWLDLEHIDLPATRR